MKVIERLSAKVQANPKPAAIAILVLLVVVGVQGLIVLSR